MKKRGGIEDKRRKKGGKDERGEEGGRKEGQKGAQEAPMEKRR